jgi:competence ComEA-like helix-hairpin-helix protein
MTVENTEAPFPEDQNQTPNGGDREDMVPDWMKEAGWEKSSGAVDESKPVFDDLDEEDEIVPAEIPAWLEDAAPTGYKFEPDTQSGGLESKTSDQDKALIDDDLIPISPLEDTSAEPPAEADPAADAKPLEQDEPELDVPSWLKNLELDEDSQETAVAWLENMPESLRSQDEDEEIPPIDISPEDTSKTEDISDDLEWMDDLYTQEKDGVSGADVSEAELSEDLVAAELIPEQPSEKQLFDPEEIDTLESDVPSWLDELGEEEKPIPDPMPSAPLPDAPAAEEPSSLMPDWLSELGAEEEVSPPTPPQDVDTDSAETEGELPIPDWLGEFEDVKTPQPESEPDSLAWLESLGEKKAAPTEEELPAPEQVAQAPEEVPSFTEERDSSPDVSPSDDTLNTEIPDWLSKIGDKEPGAGSEESLEESGFEESAAWLDQLGDEPIEEYTETATPEPAEDSEVLEWLEGIDLQGETPQTDADLREALTGEVEKEIPPPGVEPMAPVPDQGIQAEDMPDWLAELDADEQDLTPSLQSAIRQSDHTLTEEEKEYLDRADEEQDNNADWLAKLDLVEDQVPAEPESPAIKVVIPEEEPEPESFEETPAVSVSGGILDRLKDPEEETLDPEVPLWLENLKKEEDPQETAILWLQQFVEQGDEVNLKAEIKRYTDELDPGDTVPKWMEDLKNEEDPQTTAMLWLEKLSGEREKTEKPTPSRAEQDESGWLTELEKEAEEQEEELVKEQPKDFHDASNGWLADLEIDEKLKSAEEEQEIPDWTQSADSDTGEQEDEAPPWMIATSPLEGDFYTDELAGGAEKEVEIPAWLAGYGEGEGPEEIPESEVVQPPADDKPPIPQEDHEEYAWVSTTDEQPRSSREPFDLNIAAISELESILGISYQIAKGIVTYREKQGPYKTLEDLLKVPEITDEQTIEILKPEVIIRELETAGPPPVKETAPVVDEPPEKRLTKARGLMADSQITEALEHYEYLIIKKSSIQDVIEDLIQASYDHPMDVSLMKTLGDAYMRLDKLDEALDAYSKAEDLLR